MARTKHNCKPNYPALIELFDEWERTVPEDAKWAKETKAKYIQAMREDGALTILQAAIYQAQMVKE